MYLCIFILRICARRRRSLNEAFLVKIANIIIVIGERAKRVSLSLIM